MSLEVIQFGRGDQVPGGTALALDAYDGLHPGHLKIVEDARDHALKLGLPLSVFSMEPHPRRLLHRRSGPFSIITRDQEIRILERIGVDRLYILQLNLDLVELRCEDFASEVLAGTLHVGHVSAVTNVPFGKGGKPSGPELKAAGARLGFSVSLVEPATAADGMVFSGDDIRKLAPLGKVREMAAKLGRPFAIRGAVEHGAKLGRTIGFPTANVSLGDYVRPAAGIYASVSLLQDGRRLPSLSYIGRRPTVDNGEERLEVFLFDFNENLYGQQLETALVDFLRPDAFFPEFDAMLDQMAQDRLKGRPIAEAARDAGILRS